MVGGIRKIDSAAILAPKDALDRTYLKTPAPWSGIRAQRAPVALVALQSGTYFSVTQCHIL
jgi:hypothetical protein